MTKDETRPDAESDDRLLNDAGSPGDGGSSEVVQPTETETLETAKTNLPKRIGQYSIKRATASGGMGTVYEALQEKPRRTVALQRTVKLYEAWHAAEPGHGYAANAAEWEKKRRSD